MSFLDDLDKAVGMFEKGAQKLATTQAFDRATQQLDEINLSAKNEAEKRMQMSSVSQQLVQSLAANNVPISQMEAAFKAFSPVAPTSAAEDILVGSQFNDPTLAAQGQKKAMALSEPDWQRTRQQMLFADSLKKKEKEVETLNDQRTEVAKRIATLPKNLQGKASAELNVVQDYRRQTQIVSKHYEQAMSDDLVLSLPATEQRAKLGAINALIYSEGAKAVKGAMTDEDFKLGVKPYQLSIGDYKNPARIEAKQQGLLNFIDLHRPSTAVLDEHGIDAFVQVSPIEEGRNRVNSIINDPKITIQQFMSLAKHEQARVPKSVRTRLFQAARSGK